MRPGVRGLNGIGASDLLVGLRLLERGRRDALVVFLVRLGVFGVACVVVSEDMPRCNAICCGAGVGYGDARTMWHGMART